MAVGQGRTPPDIRVPNAIVGELINASPDSFWRLLGHRSYLVGLGLMGLVDPDDPGKEVTTKATKILEIIEVVRTIQHKYLDEWERQDGTNITKTRKTAVFRPKLYKEVGKALVGLFTTTFMITKVEYVWPKGKRTRKAVKETTKTYVHFLDSFRFIYLEHGEELDLDLASPGERVNVSENPDRPVFKLRGKKRPSFISFRLNTELADELSGKGRRYTTFLGAVFGLLKELANDPGATRTALWVISQRQREIKRNRSWLVTNLLAGAKHQTAGEGLLRLEKVLAKLQNLEVIEGVHERQYAPRSRNKGSYLVITKAEKWHLARAKEGA